MKKMIVLSVVLFIASTSQGFAKTSSNSFEYIFDIRAHFNGATLPDDVEKRSFEFVPIIKKGEKVTFKMGSGESSDNPVHDVTLTKPFEMQKTEVTQLQYKLIMDTNPSHFQADDERTYNRPVENVSYIDVQRFIKKMNSLTTMYKYRLPTEAEWEYAADKDSRFLEDFAWLSKNSNDKTNNVALNLANRFTLYDMFGNVREWTSDVYDEEYYSSSDKFTDPQGPNRGDISRVVRGGSWKSDTESCRSSVRDSHWMLDGNKSIGFRLVRTEK